MPINPVNAQLVNPGDSLTAVLNGDPQVILSLAGTFQNGVFAISAMPWGQQQFIPVGEVRGDTGTFTAGTVGPLTGSGSGSGLTLRADGGPYSQFKITLVSIGGGACTAGIATVPFPYSSNVTVVTGTVSISGTTAAQGDGVAPAAVLETGVMLRAGAVMDQLREAEPGSGAALAMDQEARRQREGMLIELVRIRIDLDEIANKDTEGEVPDVETALQRIFG